MIYFSIRRNTHCYKEQPRERQSTSVNGANSEPRWYGNATKHMVEFVNSANGSILVERELMASLQSTVSEILPQVQPGRNFFELKGWQIGINGDSGVIYHALYR